MVKENIKIAETFSTILELLEIKGEKNVFKLNSYRRAIKNLKETEEDVALTYKKSGLVGIRKSLGVGESIAKKIEEYLKKNKIKYLEELKEETKIQQVISHFFKTKGISLNQLKYNAKKKKIIYSRFTKPAKQLIELAGSVKKAEEAIDKVAQWANSRNLDYAIETVFKKWLELDRLKPKEIIKKPFYQDKPMVWSETKKKWYVIDQSDNWLEFADKEDKIEWKTIK